MAGTIATEKQLQPWGKENRKEVGLIEAWGEPVKINCQASTTINRKVREEPRKQQKQKKATLNGCVYNSSVVTF